MTAQCSRRTTRRFGDHGYDHADAGRDGKDHAAPPRFSPGGGKLPSDEAASDGADHILENEKVVQITLAANNSTLQRGAALNCSEDQEEVKAAV